MPPTLLDAEIDADLADAALVVVFEPAGVTGHHDHRAATAAATRVAGRHKLPVLEWGVAAQVAAALNAEFGTAFAPLTGVDVAVDRTAQLAAIDCHESQSRHNPVLFRRLALQGPFERVRLRTAGTESPGVPPSVPLPNLVGLLAMLRRAEPWGRSDRIVSERGDIASQRAEVASSCSGCAVLVDDGVAASPGATWGRGEPRPASG